MKLTMAYHPVWEQTLTNAEKDKYECLLNNYKGQTQSVLLHPITIKRKKNNGLVATVFICNGINLDTEIKTITVKVMSANKTIAKEQFSLQLTIPSLQAMPWSFVFQPSNVYCDESPNADWTIHLI